MTKRTLRSRAFVDRWFEPLVVLLVVLALLGAYGSYLAYVAPETTTDERTVDRMVVDGSFAHSATVTESNPVFEIGDELENRSLYFTSATPSVNGFYSMAYRGGDSESVSVELQSSLVLRATDGEEQTYWRVSEPLNRQNGTDIDAGGHVSVPFSVNVSAVAERLSRIDEELGSAPGELSAHVAVDARVSATVDDEPVELRVTERLPIAIDGETYAVTRPDAEPASLSQTQRITVPQTYGPLYTVVAPVVLLSALCLLAVTLVTRQRGALRLTESERAYLAYLDDRREFSEWLARIRLPPEALRGPRAEAASLADLVDFAIDAKTGVVESPEQDAYYVVTDDCLFVYTPPDDPTNVDSRTSSPSADDPRSSGDEKSE